MMNFKGEFAKRLLAILLVVSLPACTSDRATEPAAPDSVLRIEAASPTDLKGIVGESVSPVPTVVVKNERGQAVPGTKVVFIPLHRPESGDPGSLTNTTVVTDSRGFASLGSWKLGTVVGLHGLEAHIVDEHYFSSDLGRVVAFRAEAKAAAAQAISMEEFPADTVGLPGDELYPPIFRVIDRFGNSVTGTPITFAVTSGGGSLGKPHDETSRFGYASPGTWTLGPKPGLNSIVASAPGLSSATFNARALDVGRVTWYDLVPQSVRLLVSASIALCEDGTFEMITVETSDAFPGEWPARQFGRYTLTGTVIVLTFSTGVTEQGTLVDHRLSVVHKNQNWVNYAPEEWRFDKRQESTAQPGVPLFISGVMTPHRQAIRVHQAGKPITDAEVTVNGMRIPHFANELYLGDLTEEVPAGGTLSVKVVAAGRTFEAAGEVVGTPVITDPATGSKVSWRVPIKLAWSVPADPEGFDVCLNCVENTLEGEVWPAAGDAREFMIPPGALVDYGTGAIVAVYALKSNFLKPGSAGGTSDVLFRAKSSEISISIGP